MRKTYVQVNGVLYEKGTEPQTEPVAPMVMPDIKPYQSMIDGSEIKSRSHHREHLRQHGCIEVGNDSSLYRKPQPLKPPPGLKERLIENANRFLRHRSR